MGRSLLQHFRKPFERILNGARYSFPHVRARRPREQAFAELIGVPIMVQARPYVERVVEFRPFACSDFIIPVLTKLCPPGEKMDSLPSISSSVWLQICPDVPAECPAMVMFLIQIGRLAESLDDRCRREKLNKPNAGRPSVDLDEALRIAMPVWSAEEEYLIMKVTLNAIDVLRRWMRRPRRRRAAGETLPPTQQPEPNQAAKVKTARKTKRSTLTSNNNKETAKAARLAATSEAPPSIDSSSRTSNSKASRRGSTRKVQGSASSPSVTAPNPAAAVGGGAKEDNQAAVTAAANEGEQHESTRARQRLEQAKVLDKKVEASREEGGGGN
ncbi:unnamed protein product [Ectocarpus sp. CCAP 1310/34]|nr:unnamed protein product [Ectocarpus sp. CCAP 1310/34]